MKTITLENKLNIINLYNNHQQVKDIANSYNVSPSKLRYWLKHQSEIVWRGKNRLFVDETYFNNIDSSNKAYILGLISADGCVRLSPPELSIQLQYRDKHILIDIKKEMQFKGEIKDSVRNTSKGVIKKYSRIRICNKNIVNSINHYGIHPRKTYGLSVPTCINTENFRHFLRGYFDGDGCLYINPNGPNNRGPRYAVTLTCEKTFSIQLANMIEEQIGVKFRMVKLKSNVINNIVLERPEDIEKFLKWIYFESGLKLLRKYKLFCGFLEIRKYRNRLSRRVLSSPQVEEIKGLISQKQSINSIAKKYKVNRSVIDSIKNKTGYVEFL